MTTSFASFTAMISSYSFIIGSGAGFRIDCGASSSQKLLSMLYDIFVVSAEVLTLYLYKEDFPRSVVERLNRGVQLPDRMRFGNRR
jgi:hypothetical protein